MLKNKHDRELWQALHDRGIELYVDDIRPCSVEINGQGCGKPTPYSTAELVNGLSRSYWYCHYRCEEHIQKLLDRRR